MRRLTLIVCVLLAASAAWAQNGPADEEYGASYSEKTLRSISLEGLSLGMDPFTAEKVVLERGYNHFHEIYPGAWRPFRPEKLKKTDGKSMGGDWPGSYVGKSEEFGQPSTIGFGYTKVGGEKARVSSIELELKLTDDSKRDVEGWRRKIFARFGEPTGWKKEVDQAGRIADEMLFAIGPQQARSTLQNAAWSCRVRWQCEKIDFNVDCRNVLAESNGPLLHIMFGVDLRFELDDQDAQDRSINRDSLFRRLDTKDETCPNFPIGEY